MIIGDVPDSAAGHPAQAEAPIFVGLVGDQGHGTIQADADFVVDHPIEINPRKDLGVAIEVEHGGAGCQRETVVEAIAHPAGDIESDVVAIDVLKVACEFGSCPSNEKPG